MNISIGISDIQFGLPNEQRTLGFSIWTNITGSGAVTSSWLVYVPAEWMGVSKRIVNGILGAPIMKRIFDSRTIALINAAVRLFIEAITVMFIQDKAQHSNFLTQTHNHL